MKKEENMVNFDLSVLSLSELISLYEKVNKFIEFLDSQRQTIETKGDENNE